MKKRSIIPTNYYPFAGIEKNFIHYRHNWVAKWCFNKSIDTRKKYYRHSQHSESSTTSHVCSSYHDCFFSYSLNILLYSHEPNKTKKISHKNAATKKIFFFSSFVLSWQFFSFVFPLLFLYLSWIPFGA